MTVEYGASLASAQCLFFILSRVDPRKRAFRKVRISHPILGLIPLLAEVLGIVSLPMLLHLEARTTRPTIFNAIQLALTMKPLRTLPIPYDLFSRLVGRLHPSVVQAKRALAMIWFTTAFLSLLLHCYAIDAVFAESRADGKNTAFPFALNGVDEDSTSRVWATASVMLGTQSSRHSSITSG